MPALPSWQVVVGEFYKMHPPVSLRRGLRWSLALLGYLLLLAGTAFFLGKNSLLRALAERRIHRQTSLPPAWANS